MMEQALMRLFLKQAPVWVGLVWFGFAVMEQGEQAPVVD